ncbi:hypothetical protein L2E82_15674 [Cichorium intybus]|uniref:Uncharacterized protein n=1 Tax=Cichorium intybus TaxID=13427 RepID=A0ACB9F3H3_CICIN|nr:hypothetical protein L2E82_15674 [Cichorium intybus]
MSFLLRSSCFHGLIKAGLASWDIGDCKACHNEIQLLDLVVNLDFRFGCSSCQSKQSDPSDLANTFFSTSRIIHQESGNKSSRI